MKRRKKKLKSKNVKSINLYFSITTAKQNEERKKRGGCKEEKKKKITTIVLTKLFF